MGEPIASNYQSLLEKELLKVLSLVPGALLVVNNHLEIIYMRADGLLGVPEDQRHNIMYRHYIGIKVENLLPIQFREDFIRRALATIAAVSEAETQTDTEKTVSFETSILRFDGTRITTRVQMQKISLGLIIFFPPDDNPDLSEVAQKIKQASQTALDKSFLENLAVKTDGITGALGKLSTSFRGLFGQIALTVSAISSAAYLIFQQVSNHLPFQTQQRVDPVLSKVPISLLFKDGLRDLPAQRLFVASYKTEPNGTVSLTFIRKNQLASTQANELPTFKLSVQDSREGIYQQHLKDQCVYTDVKLLAPNDKLRLELQKAKAAYRISCPFYVGKDLAFVGVDFSEASKPDDLAPDIVKGIAVQAYISNADIILSR